MHTEDFNRLKTILTGAYDAFNKRDITGALKKMQPDVSWPNGMEGGTVYGHDGVRSYWSRQWTLIDPHVEPLDFRLEDDGRVTVTVHQVVHTLAGNLLADQTVYHVYTFKDELVAGMEIKQQPNDNG